MPKITNISYGLFNFDIDSDILESVEFKYKNEDHYKSYKEYDGKPVQIIPILQIHHIVRSKNIPILKDGENDEGKFLTARERVVNILTGFDEGQNIKPIKLYNYENADESISMFKLSAGCHRLHCSILYGFRSIPATVYEKKDCVFS